MKTLLVKNYFLGILISAVLFSCTKDSSAPEVTYEVHLTNAPSWFGSYIDEHGNTLNVQDMPDNWKYTFKHNGNVCCAFLGAMPECLCDDEDAEVTISVNGKVVAHGYYSESSYELSYTF
jgi:hypothetical protein